MGSDVSASRMMLAKQLLEPPPQCIDYLEKLRRLQSENTKGDAKTFQALQPDQFSDRSSPSCRINSLKPLEFPQLRLGHEYRHLGQFITGELLVDPFTATVKVPMERFHNAAGKLAPQMYYDMVTIVTAIKDKDGNCLRLDIHNIAKTNDSVELIQKTFPKGLRVVIVEPLFTLTEDGRPRGLLRVENPADIVLAGSCSSYLQHNNVFPEYQKCYLDGSFRTFLQKTMDEAKEKFRSGKYHQAIEMYSTVTCCTIREPDGHGDADANFIRETALTAYSNRAEVFLRLESPVAAFADTTRATDIDPGHLKSLMRKARAIRGLDLHLAAAEMYKKCISVYLSIHGEAGRNHAEVKHMLESKREAETSAREGCTGNFDLSALYSSGLRAHSSTLQFSDWVGPVTMKTDVFGGLGLFATEDVEPGDLIFVNNAIAMKTWRLSIGECFQNEDFHAARKIYARNQHDLFIKILEAVKCSPKQLARLYSLEHAQVEDFDFQLDGSSSRSRPNPNVTIDLFKGDRRRSAIDEEMVTMDVGRIRRILSDRRQFFGAVAGLGRSIESPAGREWEEQRKSAALKKPSQAYGHCGLWALLNFMRHSCAPNTWVMRVGSAIFVRSLGKVKAGEEFTFNQLDDLTNDAVARQERANSLHFHCDCERCDFENRFADLTHNMIKQRKRFSDVLKNTSVASNDPRPHDMLKDLVDKMEDVIKEATAEKNLSLKEQGWIRASVLEVYMYLVLKHTSFRTKLETLQLMLVAVVSVGDPYKMLSCVSDMLVAAKEVYRKTTSKEYLAIKEEVMSVCKSVLGNVSMATFKKLMRNNFEVTVTESWKVQLAKPEAKPE